MTITYKCDTCNRSIDVQEHKRGLNVYGKCIITKLCKGQLHFVQNNANVVRPEPSETYNDWTPKQQIAVYNKTSPQKNWKFEHNLNTIPAVTVYINNQLVPNTQYDQTITADTVEIKFATKQVGTIQCVVRNPTTIISKEIPDDYVKVSTGSQLNVCVHSHNDMLYVDTAPGSQPIPHAMGLFINGSLQVYTLNYNNPQLAWGDISKVHLYGNIYNLYSFYITTDNNSIYNYSSYEYQGENPLIYILLSNSTNFVDKVYTNSISVFDLNKDNNYIKDNELYVKQSIIRDCFPHIKII
jgi:hypothetical protein